MRSHRFHLLDGLRGIAAILVVIGHTPQRLRPLLPMREFGLAVDFFFLLSGFVIAFAYESRLLDGISLRDFLAARLIRLYPLYLIGTILGLLAIVSIDALAIHPHFSNSQIAWTLPSALLLLPNFLHHWPDPTAFPFDPPAWSLFVEMVANLLFAFLLRKRLGNTFVLLIVSLASLFALLAAVRYGTGTLGVGVDLSSLVVSLPRATFSFFNGVLVFHFYRSHPATVSPFFLRWVFPLAAGIALISAVAVSFPITRPFRYELGILAVIFPVVLYLGANSQLPAPLNRLCAFLGDVSYPLYILHAAFIFPISGRKGLAFLALHPHSALWMVLLVVAALIPFTWLVARHADRPIRLWLTHLYNQRMLVPRC